ncbi:MAG TPA: hypothetical protein VGD98_25340 [Ktedonobacteraceae bacterium]
MHYPEDEKTFQQQPPAADGPPPVAANVPDWSPPAFASVPNWPPPPRIRPPQGPPRRIKLLLGALAGLLVLGCLSLLIYSTTSQYNRKLNGLDGSDLTTTAQGIAHSQAIRNGQATRTAVPLQTANAQFYATATASAGPAATASVASAQGTTTTQARAAELAKVTAVAPTFNDPLSGNTQGNMWDTGYSDNNQTGCNFVNGSYQVQEALLSFLHICFADASNFRNFAYQVSMTLSTNCAGGIVFRGNNATSTYYFFTLDAAGNYRFEVYGKTAANYASLAQGSSSAILGLGQPNTITVIANQAVLDVFVNQVFVTEVLDARLSTGQIGVGVYNLSVPASANFSNAQVWKI